MKSSALLTIAQALYKALLAALCVFPLLSLTGCGHREPLAADQSVAVVLRTAKQVDEPVSVSASGAVEGNITALTAFQIAGRVEKVFVDEGQFVKKGQVLAELDPADYRNAFEAAAGQAEAAQAVDLKSRNGLRPQELEQARIDFERMEDQYKRMKFLYDHQSLAANDFHPIEAAYLASRERYEMARQGTRGEEKQSAGAQLHAAQAQLNEAKKHLADCRLLAPITGFIGMRRVDVGNTVAAGNPVFSVVDLDPAKIRVGVPEAQVGKIAEGARAVVTIPSLDGRQFEGKLEALGMAADAASRTFTAKITVANPEHLLRAGMVSQSRIFGKGIVHALTVPGDAIVRDARGVTEVYVYYPEQQRVFARRVEVGGLIGTEIEVTSGLTATDQIVVSGQQNVREGAKAHLAGGGR